jgi:protein gp37
MTNIEWTEKTWNPIVGCSIVSPGCTNCYAMKMAARLEKMMKPERRGDVLLPHHYTRLTKPSNGGPVWTGRVNIAPDNILLAPLRRKKPTMYFVNSMGDLFHESIPDEWIDRVFAVMARCPQHTFQVLTKRSERMREYCAKLDRAPGPTTIEIAEASIQPPLNDWPLPNVWLGVSAERQTEADERIPDLLATPAAVRFVSAEPLLEAVDFTDLSYSGMCLDAVEGYLQGGAGYATPQRRRLDWIIVGGESGANARPMHPDWARSIRDQCTAAGVPFFFKQWGEWAPTRLTDPPRVDLRWLSSNGGCMDAMWNDPKPSEADVMISKVGKKSAGRLLDDRDWSQMPLRESGV